ncbi:MAG: hypothetical protein ND895_26560 [Pyrinomonadaceae bacterium]|nr:hypothetical protein [Pyrinomonadaceae bacterium]
MRNDPLLKLYYRLPLAGRTLAASARGLYLRSWRYGADTDQLVEDAINRESWSAKSWENWQGDQLALVLRRAALQVPHYREMWATRRRNGDTASFEELANWPILEKETLRQNPSCFVADDCNPRRMFREHTSGTSAKPLELWWSRSTVRQWYAIFEARSRRWYGVSRHDRWGIFGGQLVTQIEQRQPPFWVWNAGLNQLYLSTYHLAPDLIPAYLDALSSYRITYLVGYTSALYALALEALRLERNDIQLKVIITNAEPLFDYQRKTIAEAFRCSVHQTYGMAELVGGAGECSFGNLHCWPEVGIIEVDATNTSDGPNVGDFICTGLLNADMPLIRYRVGDRGSLSNESCACGRTLPIMRSLQGRIDDVLYTTDGRPIGRLDPVFKGNLHIREAQIIQETLKQIRVRFVRAPGYSPQSANSLVRELKKRLGPVEVVLEEVTKVPRTANGKFRAVVCNLPTGLLMQIGNGGNPSRPR